MDAEGNVEEATSSQPATTSNNQNNRNHNYENPVLHERYTKLSDPPPNKLVPIPQKTKTSRTNVPLPPIHHQLDRNKYPQFTLRQEFMPRIGTPTGSVAGSIAESSIRSDMSRTRYEAESPDELALVRAASTYNCCLKGRTAKSVIVWLPG